jgi:uncharacterized protein YjbI with pentapeptide repeats
MELKAILKDVLTAHSAWLRSEGKEGRRAELRGALLQEADLHDVDLREADLQGAKLSVADLMRTNLSRANLQGVDFWMADMKDTNLVGALLQGANLSDVTNLTAGQIASAITDDTTILPAGLRRA